MNANDYHKNIDFISVYKIRNYRKRRMRVLGFEPKTYALKVRCSTN